ncbi:hypothetical protein, partial [Luedemannella flava]|uniref:hypothetical protein n=1 Tax=Luedemannella flava TaxID=349316 RepID=UPI0031DF499F
MTGLPEQLKTNNGLVQYVSDAAYTEFGELSFVQFNTTSSPWLQRSFAYEDATRRLKDAVALRQTGPQGVDAKHYEYDDAGNTIKVTTTSSTGAVDTQCFGHDYARRLNEAWTPGNGDCNPATRSATGLGGPAPYWHSWTFDAAGNRKTQTVHTTTANTTTDYNY